MRGMSDVQQIGTRRSDYCYLDSLSKFLAESAVGPLTLLGQVGLMEMADSKWPGVLPRYQPSTHCDWSARLRPREKLVRAKILDKFVHSGYDRLSEL
jgi:hypothetical protein